MQAQSYDDMCQMGDLNEQTILRNLVSRYNQDQIFTYIGPTLLAVNPYRKITKLFNEELNSEMVKNIQKGLLTASPHIYYIAGKAFHSMKNKEPKQSIIISGESGAGKTESTKYCMEILTKLSAKKSHSIQRKILACNPLLEAFGNSKTVRNENSSRFGKFVQILFGKDHAIKGAKIQSYLLEKSRVTMVAENQRNFHVFYALTSSGLLGAKRPEEYAYLNRSNCYHANNIDDQKFYQQIIASFNQIGFSQSEQSKIWMLLLGILQLGNLQFDDTNHQDNTQNPCVITNKTSFLNLAQMLELQPQKLQQLLLYKSRKILKQTIYSPIKKADCQSNRDTLSKSIYNLIFQFIIDKIEVVLNPKNQEDSYELLTKQSNFQYDYSEISILDIFGFQNFAKNSLQQICINFTNEKLLEQYNKKVFDSQINILKQDGLEDQVSDISPPSNAKIITILERIFKTINEQTNLPFEEENIINNFKNQYPKDQDVKFELTNRKIFKINHSPCLVAYSIDGFKIKNQDDLTPQINGICQRLFPSIINTEPRQEGKKNVKTILKKFQESIQKLIKKLWQGSNHFVRCIKPNEQKRQCHVNDTFMKAQIKYLGVFQTIKIRKAIFPCRSTYEDFAGIYQDLFKECHGKTHRETANIIIRKINAPQSSYRLGNNRIYLNHAINDDLQKKLREYMKVRNQKATKIQKQYRRYCYRKVCIKNLKIIILKSRMGKLCQTCERIAKIKVNDKLFMGMHYIKSESQAKLRKSEDQQVEIQIQQYATKDTVEKNQVNVALFSTRPYQFQINKSVVKVFEESLKERSQILENSMIQQENAFKQEKSRLEKQKLDQFQMMKTCILQLKETIKEKQLIKSVLQQNIQNYKDEIERHISEIQRLKLQDDKSSSQRQQLFEQNKLLLAEIQVKNAQISQVASQNHQITGKFQKKISQVEQQKAKLEENQDSQKLELMSQKDRIEELHSRAKYFENMVKQYEAIVDQYKLEKDAFIKEKEGLHKKVLEKSTIIQQLKQNDHSNSKNQISNKDQQIKNLREKNVRLEISILEQCQNNEKKTYDLYELQKKLYERDSYQKEGYENPELFIKSLQIDELKEKLLYQKYRVQTLQSQEKKLTKKLNDQVNRHLKEVAEFNNKIGMANQQIRRDHLAIKQYQAKIAQHQKRVDQKPSQIKGQKNEQEISEEQIVYYIRHYQQKMSETQRLSFMADILKQFKDK